MPDLDTRAYSAQVWMHEVWSHRHTVKLSLKYTQWTDNGGLSSLQCFDTVGWTAGRASGL